MNIKTEFARLRALGWPAHSAYSAACVHVAFEREEQLGSVELVAELDPEPYDDSYLESWELSPDELARERAKLWKRIDAEGTYGLVVYVLGARLDSVWGFIGDDWVDSGYDVDLKRAALDALRESRTGECSGRGTAVAA